MRPRWQAAENQAFPLSLGNDGKDDKARAGSQGGSHHAINTSWNGNPIYPSANFRPFLLFASPLNEVSGVTAFCSAILDWLSCSPAEAEQAPDCIRCPTRWESPVVSESNGTKVQIRRQQTRVRTSTHKVDYGNALQALGHVISA